MDGADGDGALADRSGDSLHRSVADIPGCEDAGSAGLDGVGLACKRPVVGRDVAAGEDEAALVKGQCGHEPLGVGFGADHDEHRGGGNHLGVELGLPQREALEAVLAAAADDLSPEPDAGTRTTTALDSDGASVKTDRRVRTVRRGFERRVDPHA